MTKIFMLQYLRGLLIVTFLGFGATVIACPIPVFQYSLENWAADPYEIKVYHNDEFSSQQQDAIDLLEEAAAGGEHGANIDVEVIDISSQPTSEYPVDSNSLPYMQVSFPRHARMRDPLVWSGDFSKENVRALLRSPLREKLGELLLDRKTGVFILLQGSDRAQNDTAYEALRSTLNRLEQTLVLPSSAEWEDQTVQIYDKISFEVIPLSRDNEDEKILISMLLASEADLKELGDVPMAFPIYGRGLIMYALVNKGINSWTISDAGNFLAGPCSCQIKASNPGLDLLMSVDWAGRVEPLSDVSSAAPVGTGGFIRRMEQAEKQLEDENDQE